MIRIDKGQSIPAILSDADAKGPTAAKSLCNAYDSGQREFDFDSNIYGHPTVKDALIKLQHGKCCFCESQVTHVSAGDVEHFRPKAGFMQGDRPKEKLKKPGYYWLAYEWSNLLFSCEECNRRGKKNLFPLQNPEERARSHSDNLSAEMAIFVNPATDDPSKFIGFNGEYVCGLDGPKGRGETTIQELGLDRVALEERRRDHLAKARAAFRTVERCRRLLARLPFPEADEVRQILAENEAILARSRQPSAEYRAMLIANGLE